jgi:MOSC domain-containing protein YiiM
VTVAGQVVRIYIAAAAGAQVVSLHESEALPGRGLAGDRYANGIGYYSNDMRYPRTGRHLTLIAAEDLERLAKDTEIILNSGEHRRNVVTRGVDLTALLGARFRIGEVECIGIRPCPPCAHLEELTQEGVLRGLAQGGGVRAEILSGGTIRVGDTIRIEAEAEARGGAAPS